MTYFLFLFAVFAIAASLDARDNMPGNAFGRFCGVLFAAFFWASLLSLGGLAGYVLLG